MLQPALPWSLPLVGQTTLATDDLFSALDGSAVASIILRIHNGIVIFAAYWCIFNCNDALEAELHALMQGMALANHHCEGPVIVQPDSSEAMLAMKGDSLCFSAYGYLVAEIQHHMGVREFIPSKIKREQNRVAHRLALYSRT